MRNERGGVSHMRACCLVVSWGTWEKSECVADRPGNLGREAALLLSCPLHAGTREL